MPTLQDVDLAQAAQSITAAAEHAIKRQSAEEFEVFERQLNVLEAAARELQQSAWASEAKQAIRRLERDQPLMPEDEQVIRALLISDAERYLTMENNYNDWLSELRRLLKDIAHRACATDRDSLATLRAVLKDAIRLVPDIRNYLDEHRRIELFNQGLQNLDGHTRTTLARLLKDQLSSPRL